MIPGFTPLTSLIVGVALAVVVVALLLASGWLGRPPPSHHPERLPHNQHPRAKRQRGAAVREPRPPLEAESPRVTALRLLDGPEELPTLPAPLAHYVRVTPVDPSDTLPLKLILSVEIAAGGTAFTGNPTLVRGPAPELDLKTSVPLERVSLTLPCDETACPALRLELLEANREGVTTEMVPAFVGRTVVALRRPPDWRPIVWDAGVVPLLSHDRREWRSAPYGFPASSPGGVLWDGSAVAVDLLTLKLPGPQSVVPVAVWAVVSLPRVTSTEACSLLAFVGRSPAEGMMGLGYSQEGRLLHLLAGRSALPPPGEEEQRVWVTPTAEGVGPPLPLDQPIVLALRYSVRGNGVCVTLVHPDGTVWRADHPNIQPPEVDVGLIWGSPEAPMRGEPDVHRRLRIHEVRVLPRVCSVRQLWTEHQALVKRWSVV